MGELSLTSRPVCPSLLFSVPLGITRKRQYKSLKLFSEVDYCSAWKSIAARRNVSANVSFTSFSRTDSVFRTSSYAGHPEGSISEVKS